mmetsp:Transcript_24748/g.32320  ORF Transcript_24748/g.32320 Transcript_24748/m.32320 type:complete len:234 (-) Transcript_24748:549-1250(-)
MAPNELRVVNNGPQSKKLDFSKIQASQYENISKEEWKFHFDYVEFLNAVSMVLPSLVSAYFGPSCSEDQYCRFLYFHCMVHLPFSFGFHTYHIFRPMTSEGVSLMLRRLDNMFIHIASIMISYANSRSETYAALSAVPNIYYIIKILEDGRKPRLDGMMLAILLYTGPMIYYGQVCLWTLTILGFVAGILVFLKKILRPVHHPFMHCLMAWPQFTMLLGYLAVSSDVNYCPFW